MEQMRTLEQLRNMCGWHEGVLGRIQPEQLINATLQGAAEFCRNKSEAALR